MGTFKGHALPGTFFIMFAVWWTIQMCHKNLTCRRKKIPFTSTPTYPCACLCGRIKSWPIEPLVKLFFTSIGISLEIYTGVHDEVFNTPENAQHSTMFFFFLLTGVADLLLYFRLPVLKDLDYICMIMAVAIEGILFNFHLRGRDPLDTLIHTLLVYTIVVNLLVVVAEMKWRNNFHIAIARTYFIFLQGTWFWQIGFILYNPLPGAKEWDPENHHSHLIATMYFTWHCGAVFITMLIIGGCVACFHKKFRFYNNTEIDMKPLMNSSETSGTTFIPISMDSDNSEFEP